ncbi:MAG: divergent polysaccharide deacetylase family protein [Proteobacteria bacterium]|nr:divergent polysaccharide deacetylase family protein [Pseudomonadota bacterium]
MRAKPDEPRDRPGPHDPYPPVTSGRGQWIGGPGFIFILLILLILAGATIYLQATGQLGSLLAQGGQLIGLGRTPEAAPTGQGEPALQPMASMESGGAPSAPVKPLVLAAMGPAELLEKRPPPKSLRLIPGEFDQPPLLRFARPALFLGNRPRIGVLVTGLGLNRGVTAASVADLPPEITLSFSPYAPELAAWIDAAQAYGHEVLLDLPLEPRNYPQDDPGPLGLLTALNKQENLRRLGELLKGTDSIAGLATQFGDRFLADPAALRPVLSELGQRGLGLVVTANIEETARDMADAPSHARIDESLPQDASRQALTAEVEALLSAAKVKSQVLIAVPAYPLSIAALTSLAAAAKDRGLALVPATAFLIRQGTAP